MRRLPPLFATLFSLTLLACDRDVVGPGGVTRLQLSESLDTLMIGDSASLTVSAFKDDGTRVNSVVAWSSSDPSVATVDARVVVTTPSTECGRGAGVCGLVLADTAVSDLSYMTFDNAYLNVTDAHRVTARNIDFLRTRTRAGLYARASGFRLTECTIADHAANGVEVHAGDDIHINDCNIERNGGLGVDNRTTTVIDAQRNWWGDPAGPSGPAGDGVSNNVDYSNHRTAGQ